MKTPQSGSELAPEDVDYRNSHLKKGSDYDLVISDDAFDAYMDVWEAYHLTKAVAFLFKSRVPRYLDVACGTGRITCRVEPLAAESYGIDLSSAMLAVAEAKCRKTKFICADAENGIRAHLGLFELVTAFRFFGNAQDDLRQAVLSAINARMPLGGCLVINNHRNPLCFLEFFSYLRGAPPADCNVRSLTYFQLRKLLRRYGFKIVRKRAIGVWLFRNSLLSQKVLRSRWARRLEAVFRYPLFVPWAPDSVLIARKIGSAGPPRRI